MREVQVTRERLQEALNFDPETGTFTWKEQVANVAAGAVAGRLGLKGYRVIRIDNVDYQAARLAWFWEKGEWPRRVGFIDGDRTNFRPANLKEVHHEPNTFDHRTKEGRSEYQKKYRSERREVFREDAMRRKFGIGFAEYRVKLEAQNGVCAICGQPERATRNGRVRWLAIDHNHRTGALRDLLCTPCNVIVGMCGEDTDVLCKAISYIERHRAHETDGFRLSDVEGESPPAPPV